MEAINDGFGNKLPEYGQLRVNKIIVVMNNSHIEYGQKCYRLLNDITPPDIPN
jgi:hypothetical protein